MAPRPPLVSRSALAALWLTVGCARAPDRAPPSPVEGMSRSSTAAAALVSPLPPLAKTSTAANAWDLEKMPGATSTVAIDVDEGTWMSVDVSPDGKSVAFDLLGDLYVMPLSGGTARPLTSGVAWDMQPRFSPDGKWVAFISDRDGMDNVWLVSADGKQTRQVTKEKENELASPAWTPDGESIAVRKHFVSARSLGAGEVWLYHRTGGGGLMMTPRPNQQKDLGEPAFSPDGRYLYFSQDVTPGAVFEYNKDPHGTIYVIQRLDRASGRIEAYINAPGGSVSPTPSPDGKSLAFIRRVGLKTALFVQDLASGAEKMVFDGLDRDLQETWAPQGVYAAMDWTPDSKHLVFWAGGKLRRIEISTAKVTDIPFRARDTRKVWRAVRYPVEVHPAKLETKMLRWVTVSPDGKRVVFQTLGKLWIRDLPSGAPRRLTSLEGVFEQHPAFSRDGRFVAFTTWSDRELGTVRIVPVAGGAARTVTGTPGHYAEPAFSPDGKVLVYRRLGGDRLRSRLWTRDAGLWASPVGGGSATLVARSGYKPHFGAESDRVYFLDGEGADADAKTVLQSIELDGSDARTHLRVTLGSDLVISPDGKRLGFVHNFAAYVAPFSRTGAPLELSPDARSVPVVRVSRDAGTQLHFSGGSRYLHWSRGPELFTRDLDVLYASLERDPEQKSSLPEKGIRLALVVDADVPPAKSVVALVGGKIVTMRGDEVIEDGVVLVESNRVTKVGKRSEVAIPAGAKVVDVKGHSVIPGLVDVHYHGPQGDEGLIPQANWSLYGALALGVTTVHDPSHDTETFFAAAELARAGIILAPRLFSTGSILYGAHIPGLKTQIDSLDDARNHLRRMKESGAISVKSYRQRRRAQRQMVLTAARELGIMVVPEGASMLQHDLNFVVDGHTGVEHALPVAKVYADVRQLWAGTDVGYTPTLGVAYGGIWGENYWYHESDVFAHPLLSKYVPPFVLDPRARRRMQASKGDWNHFHAAGVANELSKAGVKVNLGAHGQREGLAAHWELWMLVQGGMTPHQALRAGTLNGAQYLGLDRDVGSIEPGKLADLAIVEGDVLTDIRRSDDVKWVMLNGRVYESATMNQLAPEKKARRPLYFEAPGTPAWDEASSHTMCNSH